MVGTSLVQAGTEVLSNMSGNTSVIRAAQMFTKHGNSRNVNLPKELAIGTGLGLAAGLMWKTYHWNEKRKVEEYYASLAKMQQAAKDSSES